MSFSGFVIAASVLDQVVGTLVDGIVGDTKRASKAELANMIRNEIQLLHDRNQLDISNLTNLASRFVPLGKAVSLATKAVDKLRANQKKISSDLVNASKEAFNLSKEALEAQPKMGSITARIVEGVKEIAKISNEDKIFKDTLNDKKKDFWR